MPASATRTLDRREPRATVIGICASIGGPRALETVLRALPADFPLPILVVQHMVPGFVEGLAQLLDQRVPLPVGLAKHGQALEPGVHLAPDGAHLVLEPSMSLALDRDLEAGPHRPAGDVLLESLASAAGAAAVGVVLTGMGRDGEAGVAALCSAGAAVIAQDEQTSTVFGMPRVAAETGAATVLPLVQIAPALRRLGRERTPA
jgi:two-component system chemotaxis response regulator CheB